MIDLTDDNDPMLFGMTLPSGERLVVQYMEALSTLQAKIPQGGGDPTRDMIVAAIRESARTKSAAENAPDAVLFGAWYRMTTAVQAAGNG